MMEMSDRLRESRIAAGFTSASKAAEAMGVKTSTYRSHENGQNEFSAQDAMLYGRKFRVSPGYLLTGDGDGPAESLNDDGSRSMTINSETGSRGYSRDEIPEIDLIAGLGGGGLVASEVSSAKGITFSSEVVRATWLVPDWVLSKLNAKGRHLACFPTQGDSMEPSINDGDVVFVDTRHRIPSPPGIYAVTDEWGGVVVKRLEVISSPKEVPIMVRMSSDNQHYRDKELSLDEIFIVGRFIGRFAF